MAEVGTVSEHLFPLQDQALLRSPQQGCTGGLRFLPQLDAIEIAIGQAPHLLRQCRQDLACQGRFANTQCAKSLSRNPTRAFPSGASLLYCKVRSEGCRTQRRFLDRL